MNNLSISEMFRYLFSGVFAFFLLFISDKTLAICLLKKIGTANTILIALVVGSLFYAVYKSLIYPLIEVLQDSLRWNTDNWRTYLMSKYKLKKHEAKKLYIIIRRRDREHQSLLVASQTHFLYMASLILLLFSIWRACLYDWDKVSVFIVFFIITFISGFVSDRFLEETELAYIKQTIKENEEPYEIKKLNKIDELIKSVKNKN